MIELKSPYGDSACKLQVENGVVYTDTVQLTTISEGSYTSTVTVKLDELFAAVRIETGKSSMSYGGINELSEGTIGNAKRFLAERYSKPEVWLPINFHNLKIGDTVREVANRNSKGTVVSKHITENRKGIDYRIQVDYCGNHKLVMLFSGLELEVLKEN